MQLIPAIDLKEGQCVRLRQGRMDDDTVFSDNPAEMAQKWIAAGGTRIHVVDLDGAVEGVPKNLDVVKQIVAACGDVPVQVGGGIRNREILDAYFAVGVKYAIIGSAAVRDPEFVKQAAAAYPGQVIVGLDAKDGKVATDGWYEVSDFDVVDLAKDFESHGVEAIVYTDIARDGMMQGINADSTRRLAESIDIPVIASGGVASLDDIQKVVDMRDAGVSGVIIGRALYEGSFDLPEAQAIVDAGQ